MTDSDSKLDRKEKKNSLTKGGKVKRVSNMREALTLVRRQASRQVEREVGREAGRNVSRIGPQAERKRDRQEEKLEGKQVVRQDASILLVIKI